MDAFSYSLSTAAFYCTLATRWKTSSSRVTEGMMRHMPTSCGAMIERAAAAAERSTTLSLGAMKRSALDEVGGFGTLAVRLEGWPETFAANEGRLKNVHSLTLSGAPEGAGGSPAASPQRRFLSGNSSTSIGASEI